MKEEFVEAGSIRDDLRNHGTDIIECWTDTDDTDHGADTKTRSVGCAVSFQSKQQSVVATSSGEAKFCGIGAGLVQASDARRSLLEGYEDKADEESDEDEAEEDEGNEDEGNEDKADEDE